MQACRPCRAPALENHREDKAPDDKIKHLLIVICCPWTTSSIAKFSNIFWAPVANDWPTVRQTGRDDENMQILSVIVRKPITITIFFICQNEANKLLFTFIRYLAHQ